MSSLCILPGRRLDPRAPDGAAAATLADGWALPIRAEGDDVAAGIDATCPTTSGEAIGATMAIGDDSFSVVASLVGVGPDSAGTVLTGIVSIEVVCVVCLRAALGELAAVLPDDKAGR